MAAKHLLKPEPEAVAQRFHELYEHFAPTFAYKTRPKSAVPWEKVPHNNKQLMIHVAREILRELRPTCDKTCFEEGCDCDYGDVK